MGLGAGAHGALGLSHIARETANLRKASCNKERAPDGGGWGEELQRVHVMQHCSLERETIYDDVRKDSLERGNSKRMRFFGIMIHWALHADCFYNCLADNELYSSLSAESQKESRPVTRRGRVLFIIIWVKPGKI